jgi:uncharacterized protein (TIGR02099 family)
VTEPPPAPVGEPRADRRTARSLARPWRIAGGLLAVVLVGAALLMTALRIAVLYVPDNADRLRGWIERQTHTRIEYRSLDARMRWYGPEVVLRDLSVHEDDGQQALFTAREGSVGLDLWNVLRTGEFVAGRVRVVGPRVTLVRLPDGRIRLLGSSDRPSDRPPFELDRLPAGRVLLEDARVTYRDLKSGRPALELRGLDGQLRRDRDYVVIEGRAVLPEALGEEVEFELRLKGSLDRREELDVRADVRADELRLDGLRTVVPQAADRVRTGRGPVRATVAMRQGRLEQANLRVALRDLVLAVPARNVPSVDEVRVSEPRLESTPDNFLSHPVVVKEVVARTAARLPETVRYDALEGTVQLLREGDAWDLRAHGLRTTAGAAGSPAGRLAARWSQGANSGFDLRVEAGDLDVAEFWPLALSLAPPAFDRWAGLDPRGRVEALQLEARRAGRDELPEVRIDARVAGLGWSATERWPGVTGLTATVTGTERQGRAELRSEQPTADVPRVFRAPLALDRVHADLSWQLEGETWRVSTRDARLEQGEAHATIDAALQFQRDGEVSPELSLEAVVDGLDVTTVPAYLPVGRLRERTLGWLDRAFLGGRGVDGRVEYRGPVRRFPFREGEGTFRATVRVQDFALDYYPGFTPLTEASGTVEFHNSSIRADLDAGKVGAVRLSGAKFRLADYKAAVLEIDADATADVGRALTFIQSSPLGQRLGAQFMGLRGSGPGSYDVALQLPVMSDEMRAGLGKAAPERDWFVRARLDGASVTLPALRFPAQRVAGTVEVRNGAVSSPGLRGTFLDGPFELRAGPGRTSRDVKSAVELTGRGRVGGTRLPAFIGLPGAIRMGGSAEWELRGRIEQRGEGQWPLLFDVASNLAGLEVDAPRPFAKPAAEARPTRVRLELTGQGYNDVGIDSGSARARLRFAVRQPSGQWQLERGTARFDGQPVAFGQQRGLLVAGDWPQFDLGEWLALGDDPSTPAPAPEAAPGASGQKLMEWLGPVDVHLDRATVFGFELVDVVARLRGEGDSWRIALSGPRAEGVVTVPVDLARGRPIVLDMKRLHLVSAEVPQADRSPGDQDARATDPRRLPAITATAGDFRWQARRFGSLDAVIARGPRGLAFERLRTESPDFRITASGSWTMASGGPRTRLVAEFVSTNFGAATRALGYRDAIDAKRAELTADVWWPGGPSADALRTMHGTMRVSLQDGQLRDIEPGAGRMLGLLSVGQLPRRLALDFSDVTDKGLAFNSVTGDFELRDGDAYTQNLLLKGPALDMGVIGRTGLGKEDYDQTVVVSGNTSGPLALAGALAAGPVVGAGVLVLSQLFKDQLQGLARAYYQVKGPWSAPVVQRIAAPPPESAAGSGAPPPESD